MMNITEKVGKRIKSYIGSIQNRKRALEFSRGELLEGEVLECLNNKEVAIWIRGSRILAKSRLDLEPGDRIIVEVTRLQPRIVFSLIFRKNSRSETIEVNI